LPCATKLFVGCQLLASFAYGLARRAAKAKRKHNGNWP